MRDFVPTVVALLLFLVRDGSATYVRLGDLRSICGLSAIYVVTENLHICNLSGRSLNDVIFSVGTARKASF